MKASVVVATVSSTSSCSAAVFTSLPCSVKMKHFGINPVNIHNTVWLEWVRKITIDNNDEGDDDDNDYTNIQC